MPDTVDTVFTNGRIHTMDPSCPVVEALAVGDGHVRALGSAADIMQLAQTNTETVDLKDRMVMPGLIDAHCHPVKGAIALLFTARIAFTDTLDTIAKTVAAAAAESDAKQWIIGGRWGSGLFDNQGDLSPRAWLDRTS